MKKIILFLSLLLLSFGLFAQDSTFCKTVLLPFDDYPYSDWIQEYFSSNIFETHDGKIAVQMSLRMQYPDTERFNQTAILIFDRNGNYESAIFGPYYNGGLLSSDYERVIKSSNNSYLTFETQYGFMLRLNSDFQIIDRFYLTNGDWITFPQTILPYQNKFIIFGLSLNNSQYRFSLSCYDSDLNPEWLRVTTNDSLSADPSDVSFTNHLPFTVEDDQNIILSNDCGVCKFNLQGTSFQFYNNLPEGYERQYLSFNGEMLKFEEDMTHAYIEKVTDSFMVYDTVYTYSTINNYPYDYNVNSMIKTTDGRLLLLGHVQDSDLKCYDQNLNLLWEKDLFPENQFMVSVTRGEQPILEMPNGDIVTAVVSIPPTFESPRLHLYRINPDGHFLENEDNVIPAITTDLTCYPNPFNPTISFEIRGKKSEEQMIRIYNIKGQCVKILPIASGKIIWTAKNAPSGIYFARLMDGGKVIQTKKITLIK